MEKVNIGIVGLGAIATKMHIPILSSHPDVNLYAAAERDTNRASRVCEKWNIPHVYSDFRELYEDEDLNGVFICLPNFLHYEAVKCALENDLHVFCEKPMGTDAQQALELVENAKNRELKLAVGYNRRLDERYQNMAENVRSMKLGRILQVQGTFINAGPYAGWSPATEWFFEDKYGLLYDSGCHMLDLLMLVMGDDIVEVSAQGINTLKGFEVIDNISCTFKTSKNILGSFIIGWQAAINYDSISIHGNGGSLFSDPLETEFMHGGSGALEKISGNLKSCKEIIGSFIGRSGRGDIPDETFFQQDYKFIESIKNDTNPPVSGEDAFKILEILDGMKNSLENGKTIHI